MTQRLLEIKISKALLVIPEEELLKSLPHEVVAAGLKRGDPAGKEAEQP